MPHIVDDLLNEAEAAIDQMRESALRARMLHARAELLRHMRGTAARHAGRPDAAAKIADEWMRAWGVGADAYPDLAARSAISPRRFVPTPQRPARRAAPQSSRRFRRLMWPSALSAQRSRIRWRSVRIARMAGGRWWCRCHPTCHAVSAMPMSPCGGRAWRSGMLRARRGVEADSAVNIRCCQSELC